MLSRSGRSLLSSVGTRQPRRTVADAGEFAASSRRGGSLAQSSKPENWVAPEQPNAWAAGRLVLRSREAMLSGSAGAAPAALTQTQRTISFASTRMVAVRELVSLLVSSQSSLTNCSRLGAISLTV